MPPPASPVTVRDAVTDDAPSIARLAGELGYHVTAGDVRRRLAALPAGHVVLVAVSAERVVGWLHAFHSHSLLHGDRVELAGMVVGSDCRGQGAGTVLAARLDGWARDRGVHTVRVLSGSERLAAHRFYRERGYRERKTEQVFFKDLSTG